MAAPKIEVSPKLIGEGRRLYEETDTPVHEIAAFMGLTRRTFTNRVAEWKWTPRRYTKSGYLAPEAGGARPPTGESAPAAAAEPAPDEPPMPFAQRKQRIVDAQMAVIERTLKVLGPANAAEAERTARILALVSRTMQEITADPQERLPADETDDNAISVDIDEFREELARRIRLFVDAKRGRAGGAGGDVAA